MKKLLIISCFILALVFSACKNKTDGIKINTSSNSAINNKLLKEGIEKIEKGKFGEIHSILIYKDNNLLLEKYFSGHKYKWNARKFEGEFIEWNDETPHSIMSDTKSITSLCIGIAIEKSYIKSVNQSIFDYLPNHQALRKGGKESITIEHLLTMTSGLEWNEWTSKYNNEDNPIIDIWFSDKDPVSFILEGQLINKPGTAFSYYGGNQIILGEIIKHASGLNIEEFAMKYLFNPLGISNVSWGNRFENGTYEAAGGIKMLPKDMLKIGKLVLQNGKWNDERIISEYWINELFEYKVPKSIVIPGEGIGASGYSYSWWITEMENNSKERILFALGWGGQKILIYPSMDLIVIFTGGNYTKGNKNFLFVNKYVIPALKLGG